MELSDPLLPNPLNFTITPRVLLSAIGALCGSFFYGYQANIIGPANVYIVQEYELSDMEMVVLVNVLMIGAVISSIGVSVIADVYGRKPALIVSAGCYTVGSLLMAGAPSLAFLILGRFVLGLAVGISSMLDPIYLTEIAPPKSRGRLVALVMLFFTAGIGCAFVSAYFLAENWRVLFWLGGIFPGIWGVGLFFLPESPRFYVLCGKVE